MSTGMPLLFIFCGKNLYDMGAQGAIHTLGRGSGKSGQMRTGGGGVVSQMWTSAWKKNYSYHIYEIYSDNLAVRLYIKFSFCFYSIENLWNAMQ